MISFGAAADGWMLPATGTNPVTCRKNMRAGSPPIILQNPEGYFNLWFAVALM